MAHGMRNMVWHCGVALLATPIEHTTGTRLDSRSLNSAEPVRAKYGATSMSDSAADKPMNDSAMTEDVLTDNSGGRRAFLNRISMAAMLGGLASGYGMLAAIAGRYLFPLRQDVPWLFVTQARGIAAGQSLSFVSPGGMTVVIKRTAESPAEPRTEDFVALSSTCPHLGCRVHWEPTNDRFFCPCHNGEFDPTGRPTGGPVLAANQHLPRYPLKIENGLLFLQIPTGVVGRLASQQRATEDSGFVTHAPVRKTSDRSQRV